MKLHSLNRVVFLAFALLATACSSSKAVESNDGGHFVSVTNATPADVYYVPSTTYEVQIKGSATDVKKIRTRVSKNVLNIEYDPAVNVRNRKFEGNVTIHIKAPTIQGVNILSTGSFTSERAFTASHFEATANSSGDINISKVTVNGDVRLCTNSSGDINFEGSTYSNVTLNANSSGDIKANLTTALGLEAITNSRGDINLVFATCKRLMVTANSSGDIKVNGAVTGSSAFSVNSSGNINASLSGAQSKVSAMTNSKGDLVLKFEKADVLNAAANSIGDCIVSGAVARQAQLSLNSAGDVVASISESQRVELQNRGQGDLVAELKNCGDVSAKCFDAGAILLSGKIRSLQRDSKRSGEVIIGTLSVAI